MKLDESFVFTISDHSAITNANAVIEIEIYT